MHYTVTSSILKRGLKIEKFKRLIHYPIIILSFFSNLEGQNLKRNNL